MWPELPIFGMMQRLGNVADREMFRTFNMGIGMVVVCSSEDKQQLLSSLPNAYEIGRVIEGPKEVRIV
jgi:phosphoribosylformylglycinamidine cyclo-ligase